MKTSTTSKLNSSEVTFRSNLFLDFLLCLINLMFCSLITSPLFCAAYCWNNMTSLMYGCSYDIQIIRINYHLLRFIKHCWLYLLQYELIPGKRQGFLESVLVYKSDHCWIFLIYIPLDRRNVILYSVQRNLSSLLWVGQIIVVFLWLRSGFSYLILHINLGKYIRDSSPPYLTNSAEMPCLVIPKLGYCNSHFFTLCTAGGSTSGSKFVNHISY